MYVYTDSKTIKDDGVNDGVHEEIDRMAADFGMQMKNITLAAFDSITKEEKRLSELMRKVKYWKTCF